MKITKKHIKEVVEKGNWIIRGDNNGVSASPDANGFKWAPLGEWTEAPDWNEDPVCGQGLHGQDQNYGGFIMGKRLVFCETEGPHIPVDGNKVKVRKARILMVGLPEIPKMNGNLDVSGCDLKGVTLPTSIGDSLYVRGCDLKGVTLPTSIDGDLNIRGCDLKGVTLPTSIGGCLDVRGCDLKGVTLPTSIGGDFYSSGCDLKGVTLPTSIGGWLDVRECDLKGVILPTSI